MKTIHNTPFKRLLPISGVLMGAALLSACSSSGDDSSAPATVDTDTATQFETETLDASSSETYVYYDLINGQTLSLTEAEAAASTDWHIAARRNNFKLNGGASGPGNVEGALGAAQDDFYTAGEADANVFMNATAELEEDHLLAEYDLAALTFAADEHLAAIQGSGETLGTTMNLGWYNYNFVTHVISLNDDTHWLLRSNLGTSYARFHASALTYDSVTGLDVTFEFDVQADGTDQFATTATFIAHVDAAGGEDCFDFDSDSSVACDSADWDLKVEIDGRNWNLWTNSGVSGDGSGGAFGPFTSVEAAEYTAGHISPDSTPIDNHYLSDMSAGIFVENSWYGYNLGGAHKLWPNYRTYIIDTDSTDDDAPVFALQVSNYYSSLGTSGHPTIRYVQIP